MSAKLPIMAKIGVIFLTHRRRLQKELLPYGITLNQQYLLKQLTRKEFLYPSEIAELLFCDRPTASVIIKNMERQQWVRREKDPENEKQVRISLTEKGSLKIASIDAALHSTGKEAYDPLACFSESEKQQLEALLSKLWNDMKPGK